MKRHITISLLSEVQSLSMSIRETLSGTKTVALFGRSLRIWNQDAVIHSVPLGYQHLPRSGWHQFQNCFAPN
jgi:hypothetical protein